MARISIEEARALGLDVEEVSIHENMVKNQTEKALDVISEKFGSQRLLKPKKPRKTKEDNDAERLAHFLNMNGYKFAHTPNESGVAGKAAMLAAMKKKRMGLQPGYPDYVIYNKNGYTTYIELKKARTKKADGTYYALSTDGIKCSDEQKEWVEYLNTRNNSIARFCYGYDEAVELIREVEHKYKDVQFR